MGGNELPQLRRELQRTLGLDAQKAAQAAAKLLDGGSLLTRTTLGKLRRAFQCSQLGLLTSQLQSISECAVDDEDVVKSVRWLLSASTHSAKHADFGENDFRTAYLAVMEDEANAKRLEDLDRVKSRQELSDFVAKLSVGLDRFPDLTPLAQLAELGAFRAEGRHGPGEAFSRLCALQRETGRQVFAFRLQGNGKDTATSRLYDACRLVAAGETCVVYVTHATAKETLIPAMAKHGIARASVDFVVDETHAEIPKILPADDGGALAHAGVDDAGLSHGAFGLDARGGPCGGAVPDVAVVAEALVGRARLGRAGDGALEVCAGRTVGAGRGCDEGAPVGVTGLDGGAVEGALKLTLFADVDWGGTPASPTPPQEREGRQGDERRSEP